MDSNNTGTGSNKNKIRKFCNDNIINIDSETLESELYKESIITDNIKVNGGTAYVTQNYDLKALVLPSCGYSLARDALIPAYKLLKHTKNLSKIKRIFLLGYSHQSLKTNIYLSAYNSYEGSDHKKVFDIDMSVYNELLKNDKLKKYCEYFEINTYTTTTFVEDGGSIKEKEDEFNESVEDNEYTFDIHLAFLTHLIEQRVKIVPIWINLNSCNSKDIISELGNFFNSYFSKEENFFIYSTNLTYFGRIYNYFGDGKSENKEFKSKYFLRDPTKETKTLEYIKTLDEEGLNALREGNIDNLLKISNFNYSRELLATLCNIVQNNNMYNDSLSYQIKRYESVEEGFELNLISFVSLIFYFKK
jgi:predicted class III extradiol MEMO1 family dioxygenase